MFSFFCVVFAGTAGSYYLLTSLLIPSVHPGTTLDARDPRTGRFSQSTPMPGAIFAVYALPANLDQGQKPISSGFTLGMRTPDFFSLCTVVSSPQTLSPIIWGEGAVHSEFTGGKWTVCSRRSDSGVRYEGREGEKNKEDKRERALTPTPSPLCLLVFFFLLTSSLRCPHDLNSWNRIVSRARGKLTRKGKKKTTTAKTKQQQQQQQQQTRGVSFYPPTINSRWPTLNAALDHMNALEQAIHRFFFFFCVGALPPLYSHTAWSHLHIEY